MVAYRPYVAGVIDVRRSDAIPIATCAMRNNG